MAKLANTISKLMTDLEGRKRQVLVSRFGLDGKKAQTLQAIGDQYGVTRERIRQIESLGLSEVREAMKGDAQVEQIIKAIDDYLTGKGGIATETELVSDMKKILGEEATLDTLAFVREASRRFGYKSETADYHPFWYNNEKAVSQAQELMVKFVKLLKASKGQVLEGGKFEAIFAQAAAPFGFDLKTGLNYLGISKKFCVSPYGDRGLSEWPEVNPATIRDWSYLVLKKNQKPMHFEEIAEAISKVHTKRSKVFTPTVHNELIKDGRFVLVGRGIYSLTEFGYQKGSIRDLIAEALKQKGPMTPAEIVTMVSEQRMFKKNTVLLHLQDRKLFKKNGDGRYQVNLA